MQKVFCKIAQRNKILKRPSRDKETWLICGGFILSYLFSKQANIKILCFFSQVREGQFSCAINIVIEWFERYAY